MAHSQFALDCVPYLPHGYFGDCSKNIKEAVMNFWEQREHANWVEDFAYITFFTVFIALVRQGLGWLLFEPMYLYLQKQDAKKKAGTLKKHEDAPAKATDAGIAAAAKRELMKRQKVRESGWYTVYYPISFCLEMAVFWSEPWTLMPTINFWHGWPNQPVSAQLKMIYMFELAFYIQALIQLIFFELRRKDFIEFVIHHVATIGLIGMSFWAQYMRVGLVILIVHDFADIFLYLAKTCHYFEMEKTTNAVFVIFAIGFFSSRLVVYPFIVLRSTWMEHHELLPLHLHTNTFLTILLCLHCFWFNLIFKMILKALRSSTVEQDIRSDDED